MIYTDTEITLLRLCGWNKDIPLRSTFIESETLSSLLITGVLRISRNKQSVRITEKGKRLLGNIGYYYESDKTSRGAGPLLTRRLRMAEVMLFLEKLGASPFHEAPPESGAEISYLPSFVFRRKKGQKPLGTSRFSGLLYSGDTASAVYYIARENDGLYPDAEKNTFTMNILTGGRKSAAILTGADDLSEIVTRAKNKTTKSRALTVMEAIEKFDCPVSFVPMSEQGLHQLRIMTVPEYKQRLIRAFLKKEYSPPDRRFYDAVRKTDGKYFMIGVDFDLPRMMIAAEYGIHIFVLDWQMEAAKQMLVGRNAVLHPVTTQTAEELLYLSHELPQKPDVPYRTVKGDFVYAPVEAARKG